MSNYSLIPSPPPELVEQWYDECFEANEAALPYVATQAAQWGADQELEATLGLMATLNIRGVDYVRNARRPKRPSLKEQAGDLARIKATLSALRRAGLDAVDENTIRRELEALDD